MTEYLLYLYAESPVHTGAAGSSDVLDLPVQREATTTYPVIWGQSLKGALRQAASENDDWRRGGWVTAVFGSDPEERPDDGSSTPGQLSVGDAQLVAMPVPTLRKTFAWVTSQIALARLARKYSVLELPELPVPSVLRDDGGLAVSSGWTGGAAGEVLGPCVVDIGQEAADGPLARWAERIAADALGTSAGFEPFGSKLRTDLILCGSELMPTLLTECTEQTVRVQLDASKKVRNGPFYSEYLPAETILAATLTLRGPADTVAVRGALGRLLDGQLLRIGGDETIGKGLIWGRLLAGPESA